MSATRWSKRSSIVSCPTSSTRSPELLPFAPWSPALSVVCGSVQTGQQRRHTLALIAVGETALPPSAFGIGIAPQFSES